MARFIISIYFILCGVLSSFSQELGIHWISFPLPNDSSEVLFCHTYDSKYKPQQAAISFASTGRIRVYVNERNITQDICFCNADSNSVNIQTYDVTRLLQPGENIIAVWYAPVEGQPITKQLSLEYYGKDSNGKDFYYMADGNWQCKLLEGCYVKNNREEYFDARHYDNEWKSIDYPRRNWLKPLGAPEGTQALHLSSDIFRNQNTQLRRIISPIDTIATNKTVEYDFGRPFKGTIRLTLRDCKKGAKLQIGNLYYTCSAHLDEQAYLRFLTSNDRLIPNCKKEDFKHIQIMNIEGLEYE